jgi:hypothetical protein
LWIEIRLVSFSGHVCLAPGCSSRSPSPRQRQLEQSARRHSPEAVVRRNFRAIPRAHTQANIRLGSHGLVAAIWAGARARPRRCVAAYGSSRSTLTHSTCIWNFPGFLSASGSFTSFHPSFMVGSGALGGESRAGARRGKPGRAPATCGDE